MMFQDKNTYFSTNPCFGKKGDIAVSPTSTGEIVIRNMSVVEQGPAKGHGVWLDDKFLADTVSFGNAAPEGIKCQFDHQTHCFTTMGWTLGVYKNFRLSGDGQKVTADLHLLKAADRSPHGQLATYIQELASEAPSLFGNSIVFQQGETYYKTDSGVRLYSSYDGYLTEDGQVYNPLSHGKVDKTKLYATNAGLEGCDTVTEPAATSGAFSSLFRTALTALGINNYGNTRKVAEVKKLLQSIAETALQQKIEIDMAQTKYTIGAKSGDVVIIVNTDNPMIAVGDVVTDEAGVFLPDGDYPLQESDDKQNITITVSGGVITNIAPIATATADPTSAMQGNDPQVAASAETSAQVAELSAKLTAIETRLTAIQAENEALKAQVEKLSAKPAEKPAMVTQQKQEPKPEVYNWLPR